MSYFTATGGRASFGGFGYQALGDAFTIGNPTASMKSVQEELARLGYLQNNAGVFGYDGYWGPRSATALRAAARYVGWTDAPYTPENADALKNGTVNIPADLIARLRAATPDPSAVAPGTDVTMPDADADPALLPTEPTENRWITGAALGGGAILLGGLFLWWQGQKKKKPSRVTANRRRAPRRRRR